MDAGKKSSKAQIDAARRYNERNGKRVYITLNKKTDAAIIARLDAEASKQGYIKRLIAEDIARGTRKE